MSVKTEPVIVKLNNVRGSFLYLFQPNTGPQKDSDPSYSATFLMDKKENAKDIAALKAGIDKVIRDAFKGKHPGAGRICLHDGSEKPEVDGYGADVMFVSARNARRVAVVDRDLTPLTEEDGKPYAGCYLNAVIRLWPQDNKYGRRVNASLGNVQFVRDGEPFGEKGRLPEEDFTNIEETSGAI